jgi:hypothetical protein
VSRYQLEITGVGQAFQPASIDMLIMAGWKACPTMRREELTAETAENAERARGRKA